jgi:hypothetical protein
MRMKAEALHVIINGRYAYDVEETFLLIILYIIYFIILVVR